MKTHILIVCCLILFSFSHLNAQFAGGDGTANNPWQIATPAHLDVVRNYVGTTHSDKHFILINDLDLDIPPYNSGEGWTPLAPAANTFSGNFNGAGYTISNLYIERPTNWYQSLFGVVGTTGVITGLHLDGVVVTGYSLVGGLIGDNKGSVTNCSVTGTITGSNGVGGIAGENNLGTISNCQTHGTINAVGNNGGGLVGRNRLSSTITESFSTCDIIGTGNNSYGGLVGWNDSVINNSYATGEVNGLLYSGGFVGRNYRGSIVNCYATGDVNSVESWIGGLAGGNAGLDDALISNCYAIGNVQGNAAVGGLVGENRNHGTISNSYALGNVWGNNAASGIYGVGGLVGDLYIGGIVEYSYSVGQVTGNPPIGGLIGYNRGGEIFNSYWNMTTSGQNNSGGGFGLTTIEMVQQDSFEVWDFTNVWQIVNFVTYPYLRLNPQDPPPSPYGTPEIVVNPTSFSLIADYGEVISELLTISNPGEGILAFALYVDEIPDYRERPERPDWITFNYQNGMIGPGMEMEIIVSFHASLVAPGQVHTADIIVVNNATSPIYIPVSMEVLMPDFPPPTNLQVNNQTGLFTWDPPQDSHRALIAQQERQELIEYNVYLDDQLLASTGETYYQFVDLIPDQAYTAGVRAVYDYGESEIVTIEFVYEGVNVDLPVNHHLTKLHGNYPNPFNPSTTISFSLKESARVSIKIYDIRGQLVSTVVDDIYHAGEHQLTWNGTTNNNQQIPSGIYFYRMDTPHYQETRKMILLK